MIQSALRSHKRLWRALFSTKPRSLFSGTDIAEDPLKELSLETVEDPQPPTGASQLSYFKQLGFNEQDYEKLLSKFPEMEKVSFRQSLPEKLKFLSGKGMNRKGTIRFFANVLSIFPEFLDLDLDSEIRPVFDYLASLGLSDEAILVMMIQYPHLVSYDVQEVFCKKVKFLEGMTYDKAAIAKILFSFPQIFGVSLESNIEPVVTYLTQEMDLESADLKKIFTKCPQLFGVRLSATRSKLDFLIQCGFEMSVIKALTKRFPEFLRSSLQDDLRPTLEILLDYGTKESVQNLFYKCPQLLSMSYEREILPKFRFFVELGYDPVDLRILIEQFPEVLCYSLEEEIMPAVERSIEVGLTLLETRITFAREPALFRQTIAKVMKDSNKKQKETRQLSP